MSRRARATLSVPGYLLPFENFSRFLCYDRLCLSQSVYSCTHLSEDGVRVTLSLAGSRVASFLGTSRDSFNGGCELSLKILHDLGGTREVGVLALEILELLGSRIVSTLSWSDNAFTVSLVGSLLVGS